MFIRASRIAIAVALWLGCAGGAIAEEGCCAECGCRAHCEKTCRLVYEEEEVPVVCWGCKYEDFCLPGPNQRGPKQCETVCDEPLPASGKAAPDCVKPRNFVWFPGCATFHTKTKLMKKTVTKKIPTFKWVVEDLCPACKEKTETKPGS